MTAYSQLPQEQLKNDLDSCKRTVVKYYYKTLQQEKEINLLRSDKVKLNQAIEYQNKSYSLLEKDYEILKDQINKEKMRKVWIGLGAGLGGVAIGVIVGVLVDRK